VRTYDILVYLIRYTFDYMPNLIYILYVLNSNLVVYVYPSFDDSFIYTCILFKIHLFLVDIVLNQGQTIFN